LIYAIGDLHFDATGDKPMDIFGSNWHRHQEIIIENWLDLVKDEDMVLLPGDISWALKLEDAHKDLLEIEKLPGMKVISKGNHDYWWNSLNKLNNLGLKTIFFIQNNSFIFNNIGVMGTRGWSSIEFDNLDEHNTKIFNRELNRLRLSLDSLRKNVTTKIVMLHYPPFNADFSPNEFVWLMKDYKVDICIYGHLHGEGHKHIHEGLIEGIEFHCASSDYIDFIPKKIR